MTIMVIVIIIINIMMMIMTKMKMIMAFINRIWESDTVMAYLGAIGCDEVKDVAYQLVMENPKIQVSLSRG